MAKTVSDTLQETLARVVREAIGEIGGEEPQKPKKGALSGGKGVLAGAGLAAAAPLAKKALDALRDGSLDEMIADLRERVESGGAGDLGDSGDSRDGEAEGPGQPDAEDSQAGEARSESTDESRDDDDGDERQPSGGPKATGKGRRMPVQQSVDVGVPLETAYNQFTQFEEWPQFMHRVTRVTQEDDCTVSFATKIWGKTKEFKANIDTQRPDERIKWKVSEGITHSGVVTFHELAPNLTRLEVTLDVEPGSLIEKAARGMRHVKRAVRADLHRFKAFIEMQELETGAWRGVIVGGELVEPHDESYDEERDYSDIEDEDASASAEQEDEQPEEKDEEQPEAEEEQPEGEDEEQPEEEDQQPEDDDQQPEAEEEQPEDDDQHPEAEEEQPEPEDEEAGDEQPAEDESSVAESDKDEQRGEERPMRRSRQAREKRGEQQAKPRSKQARDKPGEQQAKPRSKQPHGRRSRSSGANGRGKTEQSDSGGGRRRRSPTG
jgi:uncharacterized membrane protein